MSFKKEEITPTAETSESKADLKSTVVQEKENTSENVEEIIAPTEPNDDDVLGISITEMNLNSDTSNEKETVEEMASQSAENNGQIFVDPDHETTSTTIKDGELNGDAEKTSEEIVKKILSNAKIDEEDLKSTNVEMDSNSNDCDEKEAKENDSSHSVEYTDHYDYYSDSDSDRDIGYFEEYDYDPYDSDWDPDRGLSYDDVPRHFYYDDWEDFNQ